MSKILSPRLIFTALALFAALSGCRRESGCTDPSAVNYNSNATADNGTCQYTAQAVFYTDVPLFSTASVTISGLNPSTETIGTGFYTTGGAPSCGAAGFANFSPGLSTSQLLNTFSYSATMAGSSGWSGTLNFQQNSCTPVLLPAGSIMFYTTNSNYLNSLPITVTINGVSATITTVLNGTPNSCAISGCANFGLPLGSYSYSASSSAGTWGPSTITVTQDGQCNLFPLN